MLLLVFTAKQRAEKAIKLLLMQGANLNILNKNSMSLLTFAAKQRSKKTIKLLLI